MRKADSVNGFIGGGNDNFVDGFYNSVVGGSNNKAESFYGYIGGGSDNFVGGGYNSVVGGFQNKINTLEQKIDKIELAQTQINIKQLGLKAPATTNKFGFVGGSRE